MLRAIHRYVILDINESYAAIVTLFTKVKNILWFQYRILFGILPTSYFLSKIKLSESDMCVFCKDQRETILHLFCHCSKVIPIWQNIK